MRAAARAGARAIGRSAPILKERRKTGGRASLSAFSISAMSLPDFSKPDVLSKFESFLGDKSYIDG